VSGRTGPVLCSRNSRQAPARVTPQQVGEIAGNDRRDQLQPASQASRGQPATNTSMAKPSGHEPAAMGLQQSATDPTEAAPGRVASQSADLISAVFSALATGG